MKTIRHARGWAALFSFPFPELPGQVPAPVLNGAKGIISACTARKQYKHPE